MRRGGICQNRLSCISQAKTKCDISILYSYSMVKRALSHHLLQTTSSSYITSVHQSVQVTSRLLDLLTHIVIAVEVEDISNQVQSMLIVLDVRVETCEVEAIGEVVFVNFTEVLVAS